jgi:hypothetical protein
MTQRAPKRRCSEKLQLHKYKLKEPQIEASGISISADYLMQRAEDEEGELLVILIACPFRRRTRKQDSDMSWALYRGGFE